MKFGLMFFASSEEALSGNKYQLVMESARFADANGFSSVWVPERHFTEFGSLYPNPAVLHAALAALTQRVTLIAGSVVAIGLISNAFAWLLGMIALVPVIGPVIVKVLSIGFIWLLNAVGYLVSYIAIRRGYSRDVLTYRGLTVAVIIGIVIGFVLGKLI